MNVPVRPAERSVVGEAGGRAAGREGLQGSRYVVAIQWCDTGASGTVRVRRAGCWRSRYVVARRRRTGTARRRGDHRNRARRHVVALVYITATVVDGISRTIAGESSCIGKNVFDKRNRKEIS